jgi:hypothetical protein
MSSDKVWIGWYYRISGRQVGPVPRSRIAQLVAGGQLRRSEEVWQAWAEGDEFRLMSAAAEDAVATEPRRSASSMLAAESVN